MQSALHKALQLILTADAELCNILSVTARLSISSSLIALLIGVPVGIWLGTTKFKGQSILLVLNRTLMGMPPVVCGLLFLYVVFRCGTISTSEIIIYSRYHDSGTGGADHTHCHRKYGNLCGRDCGAGKGNCQRTWNRLWENVFAFWK